MRPLISASHHSADSGDGERVGTNDNLHSGVATEIRVSGPQGLASQVPLRFRQRISGVLEIDGPVGLPGGATQVPLPLAITPDSGCLKRDGSRLDGCVVVVIEIATGRFLAHYIIGLSG